MLIGKVALSDEFWLRQVPPNLIKLALKTLNQILVLHVLVCRRLVVVVLGARRLVALVDVGVVHLLARGADSG